MCEESFATLKKVFWVIVTLAVPDVSKPFILDDDASDVCFKGVLSQLIKSNVEQTVDYYSRSLSKAKRNYAVTRNKIFALVDSLRPYRCYLLGKKFTVRTDYSALQWYGHLRRMLVRSPAGSSKWLSTTLILFTSQGSSKPTLTLHFDILWLSVRFQTTRNEVILLSKMTLRRNKALTRYPLHDIEWVNKATRPKADQINGAVGKLRYYLARIDELTIVDGKLVIFNPIEDGPDRKFYALIP